jgi:IS5 family transposase
MQWVENPCWQHFSGERYFHHRVPVDASSLMRRRQRLGEAGAEQLRATIMAGIETGAIRPAQLKRINVDTSVQTKAVRYPADARFYHRWRRLALPQKIENWSLAALQRRLVRTGGRLVKHARDYWLLLAKGHLNRRRSGAILNRIALLPLRTG